MCDNGLGIIFGVGVPIFIGLMYLGWSISQSSLNK